MPSRRSVLASGAGLVGASIGPGPVVAVPGIDDETEIVTARRGNEAIHTENVSTAWNEHRQFVRATREAFQAEYPLDETEWLRSIGMTAIDEPVCDMRQMAITVGVDDLDTAEEKLGETYRDVPLIIEEAGDVELQGASGASPDERENTAATQDSEQRDDGSVDDPMWMHSPASAQWQGWPASLGPRSSATAGDRPRLDGGSDQALEPSQVAAHSPHASRAE